MYTYIALDFCHTLEMVNFPPSMLSDCLYMERTATYAMKEMPVVTGTFIKELYISQSIIKL